MKSEKVTFACVIEALEAERDKEREARVIAVEALQKICAPESDGFGDTVADEFTDNRILEGRKALTKIEEVFK
jgi:hypothetical protein